MIVSKYISSEITNAIRFIKVNCLGRKDTRTANEVAPFGTDANPVAGMQALYSDTTNDGKRVVLGYFNANQLALVGEHRIYATDKNGVEKVRIWLHNDGTLELGGTGAAGSNTNHAAQYEGLQTAFDELKNDFNNLVSVFNAHIHTTTATVGSSPTPGVISAPTSTGSDSSADITPAKLENILTE